MWYFLKKLLQYNEWLVSIVVADALVLQQQAISILNTDSVHTI